jgi:6-pyruvoyltetrahydropterin/6-carboxytetrahydropterin synthase
MYRIAKTFHVPVGHRLSKHKGACKNFHGHNLKVMVVLSSETLDSNDMLIDFYKLKKIVNNSILNLLDHACILNINDKKNDKYMRENDYKVFTIECDPTSETMCRIIYEEIDTTFKSNKKIRKSIQIDSIRIWESDDSWAEYSPSWEDLPFTPRDEYYP